MIKVVAEYFVSAILAEEIAMGDVPALPKAAFPSVGNWTREQLKLAFYFYCETPFGKLHSRNPKIIELAKQIGRSPDALAMKLVNFASLDPSITKSGRSGLTGASRLDHEIWDEFHADWERLALECEHLRQSLSREYRIGGDGEGESNEEDISVANYTGETRQAIVQLRIKQRFFRRAVLSSYRACCCISGVSDERLLIASHIVPWSVDKVNRLNPSNGLCLSAIHDKAFDNHMFTLSDDWRIVLSLRLRETKDTFLRNVFWPVEDKQISLPDRFVPNRSFIRQHRDAMISLGASQG